MIAVDTNVLVYAHRDDSPFHEAAKRAVRSAAERDEAWAIPWPCLHEFLAIVTHPKIYSPRTPLETALDQIDAWMESPTLTLLSERDGYGSVLSQLATQGRVQGPRIHDARIASLCSHHGVSELWSVDRDFSRFPGLRVRNPVIDSDS